MTKQSITLPDTWDNLIEQFTQCLKKPQTTKRTYKEALKNWINFIGKENSIVRIEDVENYKANLIDKEYSPYTIGVYLTAVKVFFDYLIKKNQASFNPAERIERNKRPESRRESLTEDEFLRLLLQDPPKSVLEFRDQAVLILKLCTGLRDISLVLANVGDIQIKSGRSILYYQGKGKTTKDDFVVLTKRPFVALNDYLNQRPGAKPAFPLFVSESKRNRNKRLTTKTLQRTIKEFFRRASIRRPGITPHSLRHTAVTFSILGGADITQVKDMAAHKNIETTMGYRHSLERLTDPAEEYVEKFINKHLKQ